MSLWRNTKQLYSWLILDRPVVPTLAIHGALAEHTLPSLMLPADPPKLSTVINLLHRAETDSKVAALRINIGELTCGLAKVWLQDARRRGIGGVS